MAELRRRRMEMASELLDDSLSESDSSDDDDGSGSEISGGKLLKSPKTEKTKEKGIPEVAVARQQPGRDIISISEDDDSDEGADDTDVSSLNESVTGKRLRWQAERDEKSVLNMKKEIELLTKDDDGNGENDGDEDDGDGDDDDDDDGLDDSMILLAEERARKRKKRYEDDYDNILKEEYNSDELDSDDSDSEEQSNNDLEGSSGMGEIPFGFVRIKLSSGTADKPKVAVDINFKSRVTDLVRKIMEHSAMKAYGSAPKLMFEGLVVRPNDRRSLSALLDVDEEDLEDENEFLFECKSMEVELV